MSLTDTSKTEGMSARQAWGLVAFLSAAGVLWLFFAISPEWLMYEMGPK